MNRLVVSILPALCGLGIVAACHSTVRRPADLVYARFFLEADGRGAVTAVLPVSEVRINLAPKPVFTEYDIADVDLMQVDLGRCVRFELTPSATRDLYRLTASNQGRRLVLALDGVPVGARRIDAPWGEGGVMIFVEQPDGALPSLVARLKKTCAQMQMEAARKK